MEVIRLCAWTLSRSDSTIGIYPDETGCADGSIARQEAENLPRIKQWPDVGRPKTIEYLHRHFEAARSAPAELSPDDWSTVIARWNDLNPQNKQVIDVICQVDGHRFRMVPHLGRKFCVLCARYG